MSVGSADGDRIVTDGDGNGDEDSGDGTSTDGTPDGTEGSEDGSVAGWTDGCAAGLDVEGLTVGISSGIHADG